MTDEWDQFPTVDEWSQFPEVPSGTEEEQALESLDREFSQDAQRSFQQSEELGLGQRPAQRVPDQQQKAGFNLKLPDVPFVPDEWQGTIKGAVEAGAAGPPSTNVGRAVAGGIHNAPRNLLGTGLAATDAVIGSETLPEYDQEVPAFKADGVIEGLASTFAEVGVGVAGGALGAKAAVTKLAPQLTQGFRNLAAFIGGEMGMAATIDEDIGTVITGDDSLIKIIPGLALDETGNYSEEALKKRFNIMIDSMVMTPSLAWVARQGGDLGGFLWGITGNKLLKLGSKSGQEETIVRNYLQELSAIPLDASPQERAIAIRRLADQLEENKDVFIRMTHEGIDDINIRRDTMSALEESLTDPEMVSRVRGIRHHMEQRGGSQLESTLAQPNLETDRVLRQSREAFGGDDSITAAREGIQDSGIRQERALREEILARENLKIDTEKGIQALIDNDPTFGNLIKSLGDRVDIDIGNLTNMTANRVLAKLREASQVMTKERNARYAAIPDNAPVNVQALDEFAVNRNIPDDIIERLPEVSGSYKSLLEFSNFDLNRAINDLKRSQNPDWDAIRDLQALRKHIDEEQLDYLISSGDKQTRDAAQEAKRYHRDDYAPFWRDGVLEDIQRMDRDFSLQPQRQTVETRSLLEGTVTDRSKQEYTEAIVEVLQRPEAGSDASSLVDYTLANVMERLRTEINTHGRVRPETISGISGELDAFVPILDKASPGQVTRINSFLTTLRNQRFTVEELTEQIADLNKNLSSEQQRLFGDELGHFFRKEGQEFLPKSNDRQIFRDVLDDPDAIDKIPGLMKRTGEASKGRGPWDPDAVDGMKAVYSDWLREKIFRRGSEGRAGESLLAPISKEDISDIIKKGKIIYQDNPEVIEGIEKLLRIAADTQAKRGPGKTFVMDLTETLKGSRGAVDFLTTQIFGVLNRLGARVRSAAGRGIAAIDPTDQIRNTMDTVLSNPEEFARIARNISDKEGRRLSLEQKKQIYRMITRIGLYSNYSEKDFIDTLSDIERQLTDPDQRSSLSLDEQTVAGLNIEDIIEEDINQVPWFFKEPSNAKQDRLPGNRDNMRERFAEDESPTWTGATLKNWDQAAFDAIPSAFNLSEEEQEELMKVLQRGAEEKQLKTRRKKADEAVKSNTARGPQYPQT